MAHEGGDRAGRWALTAGTLLSIALLAGRLTGLLREIQLASVFGVSADADLAVLLLTLPDLLVNLLLAGGLSAALVPRMRALDAGEAGALFRQATLLALAVFGFVAAAIALWPGAALTVLAPGLPVDDKGRFAMALTALAVPLTAAAGISGAYLNSRDSFFVVGLGTLIFNACILVALALGGRAAQPLLLLSIGIGAGALVRWLSQLLVLGRQAWRPHPSRRRHLDGPLVRAFFAAAAASALMLLVPVIVRVVASGIGTGAIASFNYASKLVELPVTILLGSTFTVALSRLSALHAQGLAEESRALVRHEMQRNVLLALAVTLPGCWFADAAVSLLLGRGQMTPLALQRVADLTRIGLLGVPFVAVSGLAMARLNAQGESARVLRATLVALLALPLLTLPGLIGDSERMLMAAVVGFQVVHAVLLARAAVIPLTVGAGWLTGTMAVCIALSAILTGLAVLADWMLVLHNDWLRLALATTAFVAAAAIPIRRLRAASVPTGAVSDQA
jgi:putative peptidoglycan lipid II flippase